MPHISVVSPVYKAENIIDELVKRIIESVSRFTNDFEIILVEDGSPDKSWQKIIESCDKDKRVKGIRLSRNFGQHYAITAGLDNCHGDWIVVMDCDLQDDPNEIYKLYKQAQQGYDIVLAQRVKRNDGFLKKLTSKIFYSLYSFLSGIKQDGTIANFGIYSKSVIKTVCTMREPLRAFSPMVRWVGFNKVSIPISHSSRYFGKSSYNFSKLINLALDISLSYSDKPLKLIVVFGISISIISFLIAAFYLTEYFLGEILISGFTTIIVSLFFLSGILLFSIGVIGLYIGKIFDGVKKRPLYIISENINLL